MSKEKHYIIQSFNLPFLREWSIYNNWISNNKEELIERVRKDLEEEVLLEPVDLKEDKEWIMVNGKSEKWLKIKELSKI